MKDLSGEDQTHRPGGGKLAQIPEPLPSGSVSSSSSGTKFEYENDEWDTPAIGDLIIDLDADIEKNNDNISLNVKSHANHGEVNVDVRMASAAPVEHSAIVDKGLKMKIKRTKAGTKTSEAKHEIVKSEPEINSSLSEAVGGPESRNKPRRGVNNPSNNSSSNNSSSGSDSNSSSGKSSSVSASNSSTVSASGSSTNCSVVNSGASVPNVQPQQCHRKDKIKEKFSSDKVSVNGVVSPTISTSSVSTTSVVKVASNSNSETTPSENPAPSTIPSPSNEDRIAPSPAKRIKLEKVETSDSAVGTSVATITEPECLGPCEPGTSVTLEGIVWHETQGGVLVINVTWRGKTYVGTLLDCTRHDWAPPSFCESPTSDMELRVPKGRGKRGRGANNNVASDFSNFTETRSSVHSKLRNGAKGRRGGNNTTFTAPPSPAKSDTGKRKSTRSTEQEISSPQDPRKRGRSSSRGTSTCSSPALEAAPSSPVLIECPEPNCGKKYRHINGLKYHQSHAHQQNGEEESTSDAKYVSMSENEDNNQDVSTPPSPETECKEGKSSVPIKEDLSEDSQPETSAAPSTTEDSSDDKSVKPVTLSVITTSETKLTTATVTTTAAVVASGSAGTGSAVGVVSSPAGGVKCDSDTSVTNRNSTNPVLRFGNSEEALKTPSVITQNHIVSRTTPTTLTPTVVTPKPVLTTVSSPSLNCSPQISPGLPKIKTEPRSPPLVTPQAVSPSPVVDKYKIRLSSTPRPIVPVPTNNAMPPSQSTLAGVSLKPIQPKPVIMGNTNNLSPVLESLRKEKMKSKKQKAKDRDEKSVSSPENEILKTGNPQIPVIKEERVEPYLDGSTSRIINTALSPVDDKTGRDVQSPAYSDISDANDSVANLESDGGEKEGVNEVKSAPDGSKGGLPNHYGMFSYYGQSSFLVPNLGSNPTSAPNPGGPDVKQEDVKPIMKEPLCPVESDKDRKDPNPASGSDFPQKMLPSSYYYGYGYPYGMEPGFSMSLIASDAKKMAADGDKIFKPAMKDLDKTKMKLLTPEGAVDKAKGPIGPGRCSPACKEDGRSDVQVQLGLREKQNENHQILKESIEMKGQLGAQLNPDKRFDPSLIFPREDMKKLYIYPEDKKKEPSRSGDLKPAMTPPIQSAVLAQTPTILNTPRPSSGSSKTTTTSVPSPKGPMPSRTTPTLGTILLKDSGRKSAEPRPEARADSGKKSEGMKPTTETQGPPPPPTASLAYMHPAYIQSPHYGVPSHFDPNSPMYRSVNPILMSPHYSPNPYIHSQMRFLPGADPQDLSAKGSKALDLLQHHVSQYYSSHKIHELQERALGSPTPSTTTNTPLSQPSVTSVAPSSKSETNSVPSSAGPGQSVSRSRSPPAQRHVHTHHHTHVGLGYPLMPGQYPPYGGEF